MKNLFQFLAHILQIYQRRGEAINETVIKNYIRKYALNLKRMKKKTLAEKRTKIC